MKKLGGIFLIATLVQAAIAVYMSKEGRLAEEAFFAGGAFATSILCWVTLLLMGRRRPLQVGQRVRSLSNLPGPWDEVEGMVWSVLGDDIVVLKDNGTEVVCRLRDTRPA